MLYYSQFEGDFMYNNEELFLLLTLARAMSGEANVLENMEKEGQDLAVRKTMLAKDTNN